MNTRKNRNMGKFEMVKKCILCKSTKYHHFLSVPDRNYATGNFTYVQCSKCHLIWLNPRPTLKTLSSYYPTSYPAHKKLRELNFLQKLVRAVIKKNIFLARLFIKEQLFFWQSKGRILDVGTGSGIYLNILREWGWDPFGVELNQEAVKRAKQFGISNITQGTIHTARLKKEYFDVIRYSHVLEHVPYPNQDLKVAYKLLKKGGSIILIVPNINSIFFKLFKSYWYPLEPPRHFYQFSDQTLTKLLIKLRFVKIKLRYMQSPNPVVWSIKYILGMSSVEKKHNWLNPLVSLFSNITSFLHCSDIIEVTAQKK